MFFRFISSGHFATKEGNVFAVCFEQVKRRFPLLSDIDRVLLVIRFKVQRHENQGRVCNRDKGKFWLETSNCVDGVCQRLSCSELQVASCWQFLQRERFWWDLSGELQVAEIFRPPHKPIQSFRSKKYVRFFFVRSGEVSIGALQAFVCAAVLGVRHWAEIGEGGFSIGEDFFSSLCW